MVAKDAKAIVASQASVIEALTKELDSLKGMHQRALRESQNRSGKESGSGKTDVAFGSALQQIPNYNYETKVRELTSRLQILEQENVMLTNAAATANKEAATANNEAL